MKVLLIAPYIQLLHGAANNGAKNKPYEVIANETIKQKEERIKLNLKLALPPVREDFYPSAALSLAALFL